MPDAGLIRANYALRALGNYAPPSADYTRVFGLRARGADGAGLAGPRAAYRACPLSGWVIEPKAPPGLEYFMPFLATTAAGPIRLISLRGLIIRGELVGEVAARGGACFGIISGKGGRI